MISVMVNMRIWMEMNKMKFWGFAVTILFGLSSHFILGIKIFDNIPVRRKRKAERKEK
ncbi:MAG: hypothetical protein JW982_06055 [Spirochaetes bacterium]|nr:hypothetical protein [Spirochaetota bacterium]